MLVVKVSSEKWNRQVSLFHFPEYAKILTIWAKRLLSHYKKVSYIIQQMDWSKSGGRVAKM